MWDEGATQSLNPSYQPLNEANIPDRRLDGYALKAAWRTPGEPTALSGMIAAQEVSGLPKTSAYCGLRRATTRAPTGGHKETSEPDSGAAAMSATANGSQQKA